MQRWKNSRSQNIPHIEWIHGNALNIDPSKGEAVVGFDRIYVGASIEKENLHKLTCMLRPGGILVGPGTYDDYDDYSLHVTTQPLLLDAFGRVKTSS